MKISTVESLEACKTCNGTGYLASRIVCEFCEGSRLSWVERCCLTAGTLAPVQE